MIHLGLTDHQTNSAAKSKSKARVNNVCHLIDFIDRLFAEHTESILESNSRNNTGQTFTFSSNQQFKQYVLLNSPFDQTINERTFSINSIKLFFLRKYKQCTVTNTVLQTHLNRNTCPNTNAKCKLQGKSESEHFHRDFSLLDQTNA